MGIIWKSVELALEEHDSDWSLWERFLPDALHSIRSLMSTATRETPHERMFSFERKTSAGPGVPKWLAESKGQDIWVRNFGRKSKSEPRVRKAKLIEAYPRYARIEFENGRRDTISVDDLAPKGSREPGSTERDAQQVVNEEPESPRSPVRSSPGSNVSNPSPRPTPEVAHSLESDSSRSPIGEVGPVSPIGGLESPPRRPRRARKPVRRFGIEDYVYPVSYTHLTLPTNREV